AAVTVMLRSSVAPKGDRHKRRPDLLRGALPGCDPRSPRRVTAIRGSVMPSISSEVLRSSVAPKGGRHHHPSRVSRHPSSLRSSVAPKGDRHSRPEWTSPPCSEDVAILGRPEG